MDHDAIGEMVARAVEAANKAKAEPRKKPVLDPDVTGRCYRVDHGHNFQERMKHADENLTRDLGERLVNTLMGAGPTVVEIDRQTEEFHGYGFGAFQRDSTVIFYRTRLTKVHVNRVVWPEFDRPTATVRPVDSPKPSVGGWFRQAWASTKTDAWMIPYEGPRG